MKATHSLYPSLCLPRFFSFSFSLFVTFLDVFFSPFPLFSLSLFTHCCLFRSIALTASFSFFTRDIIESFKPTPHLRGLKAKPATHRLQLTNPLHCITNPEPNARSFKKRLNCSRERHREFPCDVWLLDALWSECHFYLPLPPLHSSRWIHMRGVWTLWLLAAQLKRQGAKSRWTYRLLSVKAGHIYRYKSARCHRRLLYIRARPKGTWARYLGFVWDFLDIAKVWRYLKIPALVKCADISREGLQLPSYSKRKS